MTHKHFKKITRVLTFRTHQGLHAYLLFFICNNRFLAYQTAFDRELRELSIGTQLFLESIRFAFENGFDEYDFLRGDEEFKTRFTKSFRKTKTMLIFPETRKGNMLYTYYKIIRPAAKRIYKTIRMK
jgi:CelD/BcsL family acetyltransferase involved in cellulose biosynthesis